MRFLPAPVITRHFFSRMREQLAQLRRHPDPETIHHFRVTVKRIRAFLRLLRFYNKQPNSWKLPPVFKKMYSTLGHLRDLQVMDDPKNDRELHRAELAVKKKLLSPTLVRRIEHQFLKSAPDTVPLYVVRSFITFLEQSVYDIASWPTMRDEELHLVRKQLKDIIYLVELVREYQPAARLVGFGKDRVEAISLLAQELGNLNDLVTELHWCRFHNRPTSKLLSNKKVQSQRCIRSLQTFVKHQHATMA